MMIIVVYGPFERRKRRGTTPQWPIKGKHQNGGSQSGTPPAPYSAPHIIAEVLAVARQSDVEHKDSHAGEREAHDGASAEGHVERRRPACTLGPDRRTHVRVHSHLSKIFRASKTHVEQYLGRLVHR